MNRTHLLNEIRGPPTSGERDRFGERHPRRLLANLAAVLAFDLYEAPDTVRKHCESDRERGGGKREEEEGIDSMHEP